MRRALITGAAGALGFAAATRLAEQDIAIVVADIDPVAARAAASRLPGGGHLGTGIDVRREDSVVDAFRGIEEDFGLIDILVCFAGVIGDARAATAIAFADAQLDDWDVVNEINARGTFLCMREFARWRRDKPVEQARIITISSLAGQTGGLKSGAAYSASKAAVQGLTRSAARDLGRYGITVNSIAPGPIAETPMLQQATDSNLAGVQATPYDVPLGRLGLPNDVAAAVAFLASPAACYLNGTTMDVNGGLFIH